ncbi:Immunoglobulin domain-containing protein oig-4 [Frankliniella fusca]|uniref:Immunoglobulin domain-containing protein oig-4 n=1 Tax=Frankliniella fusca TaxID=407009 RepID=A0AAE1LC82_9NEOP|nr:Immunoglobulin domain-containing protein oig-4 [Frankliniella fusca]
MRTRVQLQRVLLLGLIALLAAPGPGAALRGSGTRVGKGRGMRHQYKSRLPVLLHNKDPATSQYYEHRDGARIIKSSHFELDYMLGRKITFFCMARGFPRPEITWFKDGIELYYHKFFQVHEWPIGNDTIKSKMEIDPTTQKDSGFYECQANNQYAVDSRGFRTDYDTPL